MTVTPTAEHLEGILLAVDLLERLERDLRQEQPGPGPAYLDALQDAAGTLREVAVDATDPERQARRQAAEENRLLRDALVGDLARIACRMVASGPCGTPKVDDMIAEAAPLVEELHGAWREWERLWSPMGASSRAAWGMPEQDPEEQP